MTNLDSILKSKDIILPAKVHLVKLWFSCSHVWIWELDYKKTWTLKNWYFWTVVLEKTLESPLDCKEIPPVHPKGNWSWTFVGRTDAEAETPIFWLPAVKNWLIRKYPDAGKDWRQEEIGTTEDAMGGWHHWLNGQECKFWELVMGREGWQDKAWLPCWNLIGTPRCQSQLERNPEFPTSTWHEALFPWSTWRGILRCPSQLERRPDFPEAPWEAPWVLTATQDEPQYSRHNLRNTTRFPPQY